MNFWEVTIKLASQKSIFKGRTKLWSRPHHTLQNTSQSGCLSLGINLCSSPKTSKCFQHIQENAWWKAHFQGLDLSCWTQSVHKPSNNLKGILPLPTDQHPWQRNWDLYLAGYWLWHLRAGSLITDVFSLNIMPGSFRFLNLGLPTSPSSCSCILLPYSLKGCYRGKWTRNLENQIHFKNINAW